MHEQKYCPRCGSCFECRVGTIHQCQCSGVQLTLEEKAFIESRYSDCLCLACLKELKNKYPVFREKYLFR